METNGESVDFTFRSPTYSMDTVIERNASFLDGMEFMMSLHFPDQIEFSFKGRALLHGDSPDAVGLKNGDVVEVKII